QRIPAGGETEINMMIALTRIAVRFEHGVTARPHERQWFHLKLGHAVKRRVIGKIKSGQFDRLAGWVKKFEPIVAAGRGGLRLVETQRGRTAERSGRAVRPAWRGAGQQTPAHIGSANGEIGCLKAVLD